MSLVRSLSGLGGEGEVTKVGQDDALKYSSGLSFSPES